MLPELDLGLVVVSIDADMCLDEAADEYRRGAELSGQRLELPQPAAGVDDGTLRTAWPVELSQRRRVGVR